MRTYLLCLLSIVCYLSRVVWCSIEKSDEPSQDGDFISSHSFIALIDIVFTDGNKRICTGAIVDDTVVITAAHCFIVKGDPHVRPELTASFVVIGTRSMFESGYEQYLPIERVLTHPDFHGWKADLSLVYTFAAMTADKPGTVIHLAGDKIINRLDTNITVISWGNSNDQSFSTKGVASLRPKTTTESPISECSDSNERSKEEGSKSTKYVPVSIETGTEKRTFDGIRERDRDSDSDIGRDHERSILRVHNPYSNREHEQDHDRDPDLDTDRKPHGRPDYKPNLYRGRDHNDNDQARKEDQLESIKFIREQYELDKFASEEATKKQIKYRSTFFERAFQTTARSRYLTAVQKMKLRAKTHDHGNRYLRYDTTTTKEYPRLEYKQELTQDHLDRYIATMYERNSKRAGPAHVMDDLKRHSIHRRSLNLETDSTEVDDTQIKSFYKNWRRSMGNQQNQILVEVFSMIKTSQCKKLLERAVSSSMYDISEGNDFVCYTGEDHLITERDSGAPAVKRNRLVAITLGGVECDGDRVAIGMKMSCYCSWIASHIPNGKNFSCCKDCCGERQQRSTWLV